MDFIDSVSEDYMVASFLKGEANSPRFAPIHAVALRQVGATPSVVHTPDLNSAKENAIRAELLSRIRGYRDRHLFTGFPQSVEWFRVSVPIQEIGELLYANYPTWVKLSAGSRRVHDGAANIDTIPTDEGVNLQVRSLVEHMHDGIQLGELLLVGTSRRDPIILLEGHTRATAYALVRPTMFKTIAAVVGLSDEMTSWAFF
jgi:hypothetical protein